jgi:hypothetical protein
MKHGFPFLLAQAMITAGAIWFAVRVLRELPPLGSDPFEIMITGVGFVTALGIAGGALWMLAVSLRNELREDGPRRGTGPTATSSDTPAGVFAGSLNEGPPLLFPPGSLESGAGPGAAEAACEPGDGDGGGDFGCDSGGMDSGGSGG